MYHVWFATKRRKWILQGDIAAIVEDSIREAAHSHNIRLLECKAAVDHAHILLELEALEALPMAMKLLKGRSARRVFKQVETLKLDAHVNNLWQRGYGWKPVPVGAKHIVRRYIRTQMDRLEKFDR